jgi:hypothetical protein
MADEGLFRVDYRVEFDAKARKTLTTGANIKFQDSTLELVPGEFAVGHSECVEDVKGTATTKLS